MAATKQSSGAQVSVLLQALPVRLLGQALASCTHQNFCAMLNCTPLASSLKVSMAATCRGRLLTARAGRGAAATAWRMLPRAAAQGACGDEGGTHARPEHVMKGRLGAAAWPVQVNGC